MKRVTRLMAVLALVIAGTGGGALATVAAPPSPPPGLPLYLALGDSLTNGQNSEGPSNLDDYWAAVAGWRLNGYVTPFRSYLETDLDCLPASSGKAASGCRQLQLLNIARSAVPGSGSDPGLPGVTSQLLIDEQLARAEETLRARNGNDNPRDDVQVVTITVGGNEIFDAFETGDQQRIAAAMQAFAGNYATILGRLRAAAGPDLPILTMTYFNPLPYCGYPNPAEGEFLGNLVLEGIPTPLGNGLNGIIRTISGWYGAVPAEGFGSLGQGDFFDCRHPDGGGYAKLAVAFEVAWQEAVAAD